jgi:predicted TIM-barrel fold metal-dependent hydrolase
MIDPTMAREYLETGRCTPCPIVDLHAHYGHFNGIYMPNHDPAQMIATMERCGVEIIVSSGHTALCDMQLGNAEMAEITRQHPGRWYAYAVYNPNYPAQARRELELFDARPSFVGLKLHPSMHRYPITGEAYRPALEFADSRGLIVLTHTWGGSAYDRPELLAEVAERYPRTIFLAGHSGFGAFEVCMEVACRYPNVYLELTAAYAVRGLIERMVEQVGAHKIIFGCDLPWFDPHYAIGCVVMAHISDEARYAILRSNAWDLLQNSARLLK